MTFFKKLVSQETPPFPAALKFSLFIWRVLQQIFLHNWRFSTFFAGIRQLWTLTAIPQVRAFHSDVCRAFLTSAAAASRRMSKAGADITHSHVYNSNCNTVVKPIEIFIIPKKNNPCLVKAVAGCQRC